MRRALLVPLLALPALLTACLDGRDVDTGNNQAAGDRRIRIYNEVHEGLLRAQPLYQRLTLMAAIRDSGHRCVRVTNSGYQQEYGDMRLWIAECGVEEKTWQVYIAPNRDVQVRNCADAGQLALPRCQPLPPPAPVPEFVVPRPDNGIVMGNSLR